MIFSEHYFIIFVLFSSDLLPNTTYHIRISGRLGEQPVQFSDWLNITTDVMEEGHVDVNAFSVSPNEVMIQWPLNASDNLSSLNVLNLQTNGNIPPSYIHTYIYIEALRHNQSYASSVVFG